MKNLVNVQDKHADTDKRSLRDAISDRKSPILRDTYFLIDPDDGVSKRLKMGYTVIYPSGTTTGHSHSDMEEVYYVITGQGIMIVGDDEFPIKEGDALYVPPGVFHTTKQTGNVPLTVLWVTGIID